MDDDMFAELTKDGPLHGPKEVVYKNPSPMTQHIVTNGNYNMEPAQVMVVVPRPKATFFDKVKTGFMVFGLVVVAGTLFWIYAKIKRWATTPYQGVPLPGPLDAKADIVRGRPTEASIEGPTFDPEPIMVRPVVTEMPIEEPTLTVYVEGSPPVWEDPEEPHDTYEARVDENNPAVNALLQSRESFNKQLEEHLATAMKQQQT
jgi:hypothetical protein